MRGSFILSLALTFFLMACSDEQSALSPNTVTRTMTIQGVAAGTPCLVYGSGNALVGQGEPAHVAYATSRETAVVVRCGDLAGIVDVGATTTTLNAASTFLASGFNGESLPPGAQHILHLIQNLQGGGSTIFGAVRAAAATPTASEYSADALLNFYYGYASFLSATSCDLTAKRAVTKMMINMGQAVVLTPSPSGVISECTQAAVNTFSQYARVFNLSTGNVSMTYPSLPNQGCLVYHTLAAVSNLNTPYFLPSENDLAYIRTLVHEAGVIQTVCDSISSDRAFTPSDVVNGLTIDLGHKYYTEDLNGVVTDNVTITANQVRDVLRQIWRRGEIDTFSTYSGNYRLQTGYNPSGGWYWDALAAEVVKGDPDCYPTAPGAAADSNGILTDCANTIQRGTYDTAKSTWTFNAKGNQFLVLEYRGGSYPYAYPYDPTTKRFVVNSSYQRPALTPSILGSGAASFDAVAGYTPAGVTNLNYSSTLDPLRADGSGKNPETAPFATDGFRTLYSYMTVTPKTYLFQFPQVDGVHVLPLYYVVSPEARIDTFSAFVMARTVGHLGGLPYSTTSETATDVKYAAGHAIQKPHTYLPTEWDGKMQQFLKNRGAAKTRIFAVAKVEYKNKGFELKKGSPDCYIRYNNGTPVKCSLSGTINVGTVTTGRPGVDEYTATGTATLTVEGYGTATFSPSRVSVEKGGDEVYRARFYQGPTGSCLIDKTSIEGCMVMDQYGADMKTIEKKDDVTFFLTAFF